jgi:hypothetical protein
VANAAARCGGRTAGVSACISSEATDPLNDCRLAQAAQTYGKVVKIELNIGLCRGFCRKARNTAGNIIQINLELAGNALIFT